MAGPDILVRIGGGVDKSLDESLKRVQASSVDVRRSFDGVASSINALGAGAALAYLTKTAISLDTLRLSLEAVFGSSEAAQEQMEYLRATADRLGVDVLSLSNSYLSFAAASKGTTFEGERSQRIFEAVAGAMAKLGKPAEAVQDALKAIEQMMSKGKVQAEELRGQLGDHLPGAFNLAAKAMGVTTGQLNKMLETGQVTAEMMLPGLAIELEKLYKTNERVTGVVSEWNRFKSALQDVSQAFGESVLPAITAVLKEIAPATRETKSFMEWVGMKVAEWRGFRLEGDKLGDAILRNDTAIAEKNKEIAELHDIQRRLRTDTSAYSGDAKRNAEARIAELREEIKLLEIRNNVMRGAIAGGAPTSDLPAEEPRKKEAEAAAKATGSGPSADYEKWQKEIADKRRKEDDAKMSDAARWAQYEIEITRQVSAEKQAIIANDQAAADAAQKRQEEALRRLAESGASRERVDVWSKQVGASASDSSMEIKAKIVFDTESKTWIDELEKGKTVPVKLQISEPDQDIPTIMAMGMKGKEGAFVGTVTVGVIPQLMAQQQALDALAEDGLGRAADAAGSRAE